MKHFKNKIMKKEKVSIVGLRSSRDFPQDFDEEYGCYENECRMCHKTFLGYKYRRICKVCVTSETKEKMPF